MGGAYRVQVAFLQLKAMFQGENSSITRTNVISGRDDCAVISLEFSCSGTLLRPQEFPWEFIPGTQKLGKSCD